MPDGSALRLPLRDYGEVAVGGLIVNQASFAVLRRLAAWMAEAARPLGAEVVCGLPTLGHALAPLVAEALGHPNWVAAGYSRKRWYEEALSAPVSSSTTPGEPAAPRTGPSAPGAACSAVTAMSVARSVARHGSAAQAYGSKRPRMNAGSGGSARWRACTLRRSSNQA